MADITTRPLVRHLRTGPTSYVLHLRRGKPAHAGTGVAFWFRPLSAAISELPVDDRELPLAVRARTRDAQEVSVQGTLTFRITDPAVAATRLDFGIDTRTGRWRNAPLEQLSSLLGELAAQHALDTLAPLSLQESLTGGIGLVRAAVMEQLATEPRLADIGVTVVGVRVLAIRPEPELERALQTPSRELVQQEADRATYERRALAVQRERAIAENELQNQIELATREQKLVEQRGANERRRAEEAAAAGRIGTAAESERRTTLAEAEAIATRAVGAASAETEAARMAVYRDLDPAVLLALAARELAGSLPAIDHLTITPDVLTGALAQLTTRGR
jgi:regulator of protease activity HflC (stomatin/prohibitin superfamily)